MAWFLAGHARGKVMQMQAPVNPEYYMMKRVELIDVRTRRALCVALDDLRGRVGIDGRYVRRDEALETTAGVLVFTTESGVAESYYLDAGEYARARKAMGIPER